MHTEETPMKVLLEQIETKLKVISEGHDELWKRTGVTNIMLGKLEGRFDHLEIRVDVMDRKVDALGARVDALDTKVDVLGARVDALDTRLSNQIGELDAKLSSQIGRIATHLGLDGAPAADPLSGTGAAMRPKPS
jgi:tetrahydromethanopterin S-methyltransferase subunit G